MLYIQTRTMSTGKNQANWNLFLSCPHWPVTTDQRETCQYFTGYLKFQKEKVVQKFLHVRGWKALSWFNICWLRYIEGRKGAEGWSAHATNDPRKGRLHHNHHFCSAFLPGGTFATSCRVIFTHNTKICHVVSGKGSLTLPKRMNFRKSSKRPLTPPPSFSENHVADFLSDPGLLVRSMCLDVTE